ncbi:hypothetical protein PG993_013305 [Apiospora rasikravindrae]|uniref:Uncharacterized protein n=1 Tax=Apiospora rasikravindrae TaxID=990691 RepID=A0ABR1RXS3_9PEZI
MVALPHYDSKETGLTPLLLFRHVPMPSLLPRRDGGPDAQVVLFSTMTAIGFLLLSSVTFVLYRRRRNYGKEFDDPKNPATSSHLMVL